MFCKSFNIPELAHAFISCTQLDEKLKYRGMLCLLWITRMISFFSVPCNSRIPSFIPFSWNNNVNGSISPTALQFPDVLDPEFLISFSEELSLFSLFSPSVQFYKALGNISINISSYLVQNWLLVIILQGINIFQSNSKLFSFSYLLYFPYAFELNVFEKDYSVIPKSGGMSIAFFTST